MPSNMDSPGLSREMGKRDRIRPVPSPSLRRDPLGRIGGNAPVRLAGAISQCRDKYTELARRPGGKIAARKDRAAARTTAGERKAGSGIARCRTSNGLHNGRGLASSAVAALEP